MINEMPYLTLLKKDYDIRLTCMKSERYILPYILFHVHQTCMFFVPAAIAFTIL